MDREPETLREYSERKNRELEEKRRKYKPGYNDCCSCCCGSTGDHTLKVNDALEDE